MNLGAGPHGGAVVSVGAILRAHGVRGELRVRPHDPTSKLLGEVDSVFVVRAARAAQGVRPAVPALERVHRVARAQRDGAEWLLKLAGIDDRDAAESLRGSEIQLPREALPPPAEGEVYVADLVGCELVDRAGAPLGRVVRVDNYGAQELLVIEPVAPAHGEVLVPFVEPLVVDVDLAARRIVADPPEGLLDLATEDAGPSREPRRKRRSRRGGA